MGVYNLFLAYSFVIVAILNIASAEYRAGRSLKPYLTNNNDDDYMDGHSLESYAPEENYPSYEEGHSLKRDIPQEDYPSYKDGHSLHRDYSSYKDGQSLHRDSSKEDNGAIKIQGIIYCKDNGNLKPMQGATARVTCMVKDKKNGYETTPLSVETPVTDKKGYFLMNMANYITSRYSVSNCRVFLDEAAPEYDCYLPTNTNNGVSGAHLNGSKSRRLESDGSTLYSVGPFAFKTPSY
ncbi:Non-classical arabinogalactan protein 30 [Bienertia sinuspersici]